MPYVTYHISDIDIIVLYQRATDTANQHGGKLISISPLCYTYKIEEGVSTTYYNLFVTMKTKNDRKKNH